MYSIRNSIHIDSVLRDKIHSSFPLVHTVFELVNLDNYELAIKLGMSKESIESLKSRILSDYVDEGMSLSTLISEEKMSTSVSTGDSILDQFFGDSFLSPSLSIISGPPGIGKTQLLLSIITNCLQQHKKVIYLSCGCDFVLERLLELLPQPPTAFLSNLVLHPVYSHTQLLPSLSKYISVFHPIHNYQMIQQEAFGCICIDSLTFLLQPLLSLNIPNGRSIIAQILLFLRQFCKKYHIPIYMTNQTRTTAEKQTKNALSPNINYFVDNKIDLIQQEDQSVIYIDKSPYLKTPRYLPFQIKKCGFCSISNPNSIVCLKKQFDILI